MNNHQGLLFRGDKSFRVKGNVAKSIGNFAFTVYDHSNDMWEDLIWNSSIINRAISQVQGSSADAAYITETLNWVAGIIARSIVNGKNSLTEEEAEVLRELTAVRWIGKDVNESHIAASLLDYINLTNPSLQLSKNPQGTSFEHRIDELFRSLFQGGDRMSFLEGKRLNDVRADEQFSVRKQLGEDVFRTVVDIIEGNRSIKKSQQGSGAYSLSGNNFEKLRAKIKKSIENQANIDLENLFGTKAVEINYKRVMGEISEIVVTKVRKEQKIDINVKGATNLVVREDIHPRLKVLGELIKGKTFTLKNYTEDTYKKEGFKIGTTSDHRELSALFAYATGNTTYSDVATFIYATREIDKPGRSQNPITHRYRSWANTIYELLGVGTRADGRLPDYFVGNIYQTVASQVQDRIISVTNQSNIGKGRVVVRSVKDYLWNLQNGNQFVYSSGNHIKI